MRNLVRYIRYDEGVIGFNNYGEFMNEQDDMSRKESVELG